MCIRDRWYSPPRERFWAERLPGCMRPSPARLTLIAAISASSSVRGALIVVSYNSYNGWSTTPPEERMCAMSDARSVLDAMQISQAEHLPLVAAFLERMGLAAVVNAAVPSEMAVDLGSVVKLMILDTLSGRSPLYRLESFAAALDTGLLLGRGVSPGAFNDTTLGLSLIHISEPTRRTPISYAVFCLKKKKSE